VNLLYAAGVCLVLAQILGIYGLVTRKADVVFAVVMAVLLGGAIFMGVYGVYHQLR
jgi:hypothetical protein